MNTSSFRSFENTYNHEIPIEIAEIFVQRNVDEIDGVYKERAFKLINSMHKDDLTKRLREHVDNLNKEKIDYTDISKTLKKNVKLINTKKCLSIMVNNFPSISISVKDIDSFLSIKDNLLEIQKCNLNKKLTTALDFNQNPFKEYKDTKNLGVIETIKIVAGNVWQSIYNEFFIFKERQRLSNEEERQAKIETIPLTQHELEFSQQLYDESLQNMLKIKRWKLFIDYSRQQEGEDVFDIEEPGYKKAMETAFSYIRDHLGKRLDSNEYKKLHDICVDGVKNKDGKFLKKGLALEGQFYSFSFFPDYSMPRPIACREWIEEKLIFDESKKNPGEDKNDYLASLSYREDSKKWCIHSNYSGVDDLRIDALFNNYYIEMELANDSSMKLMAIARLCRALEILHPFNDGNQRTNAFALLNKLLLENDFCPVILNSPIVFDGYYGLDELIKNLVDGMGTYFNECSISNNVDFSTLCKNGKFAWMLEDSLFLNNDKWKRLKNPNYLY